MTTISVSIPNDARDYLERRARVHGITLPVLIKKAIAVYAAAAIEHERREPRKLPDDCPKFTRQNTRRWAVLPSVQERIRRPV
jgi:hypothetical protein